jgi:hypothetical protein
MIPFTKEKGLPKYLEQWQNTVDMMLAEVDTKGIIYFMADQGNVKAAQSHRRGGLHVDGVWDATINGHRGGHISTAARWRGDSRWNDVGGQLLLLASDQAGCTGSIGQFEETEWNMGDYTHLHYKDFDTHTLEPNKVYSGDALSFLHESIPVKQDCLRTLVRLNVSLH